MSDAPAALGANLIVPVVVIDDAARAPDLADALGAGGIRCAEITLRTPAALDAIRAAAGRADFVVGAGTVLTTDQVDAAADAGARFLVSPGLDDAVITRAAERGIPIVPGVATATRGSPRRCRQRRRPTAGSARRETAPRTRARRRALRPAPRERA